MILSSDLVFQLGRLLHLSQAHAYITILKYTELGFDVKKHGSNRGGVRAAPDVQQATPRMAHPPVL